MCFRRAGRPGKYIFAPSIPQSKDEQSNTLDLALGDMPKAKQKCQEKQNVKGKRKRRTELDSESDSDSEIEEEDSDEEIMYFKFKKGAGQKSSTKTTALGSNGRKFKGEKRSYAPRWKAKKDIDFDDATEELDTVFQPSRRGR